MELNLKSQLRHYLEKYDISMAQLSRRSGVSKQVISQWTCGVSPRKIEQLKSVCEVFNTSIDNLAFGCGDEEKSNEKSLKDLGSLLQSDWIGGIVEIKIRRPDIDKINCLSPDKKQFE